MIEKFQMFESNGNLKELAYDVENYFLEFFDDFNDEVSVEIIDSCVSLSIPGSKDDNTSHIHYNNFDKYLKAKTELYNTATKIKRCLDKLLSHYPKLDFEYSLESPGPHAQWEPYHLFEFRLKKAKSKK